MVDQPMIHPVAGVAWGNISGTLSDQLDLQAALDTKAPTSHGHQIVEIIDLEDELAAKAPLSHLHQMVDITDLAFPVTSVQSKTGDVTLTAADVGAAPSDHLHDDRYFTEAEANSRFALVSHEHQMGDITDLVFPVTSVNGKTGPVVLDADDVGAEIALGNPTIDGQILSSLVDGTRSWINPANEAVWGSITGTLSNQTDLQTALDGKLAIDGKAADADKLDGLDSIWFSHNIHQPQVGTWTKICRLGGYNWNTVGASIIIHSATGSGGMTAVTFQLRWRDDGTWENPDAFALITQSSGYNLGGAPDRLKFIRTGDNEAELWAKKGSSGLDDAQVYLMSKGFWDQLYFDDTPPITEEPTGPQEKYGEIYGVTRAEIDAIEARLDALENP
jgi:hypothetical protein